MRRLRVPGDKSISHRALILAALADGRSALRNLLTAADAQSSGSVLRWLGCPIPAFPADSEPLQLAGVGLHGFEEPSQVLYCGNSGTTVRLMLGVLSGYEFQSVLSGDASLCARPMRRVSTPLSEMGARFTELGEPDRLPIAMRGGPLRAIDYASPRASAQVKSAIMLAGLTGAASVRVSEPTLSRDHTERMLLAMGVPVSREISADGAHTASIEPVDRRAPGAGGAPSTCQAISPPRPSSSRLRRWEERTVHCASMVSASIPRAPVCWTSSGAWAVTS